MSWPEQLATEGRRHAGRKLGLHPITWKLAAFALLNLVATTAAIALLGPADLRRSAAAYAARAALRHAADDSWKPMLRALEVVGDSPQVSVYQRLFFDQRIKFQYPPSSLLSLDGMRQILGRPPDVALLNNLSWLFVLALAGVVPAIYLGVLRKYRGELWGRFTRGDLVAQAATFFLMTLTFYPVTRGFALGQIQTWLTCLFAGAVLAWIHNREGLSGVLVGLIVSVKPQLGVLLAWGAVHRRRRFLIGAAATITVLEVLSIWRYGLQNHVDYAAVLSYLSTHGESFFANQSVNGLMARLLHVGPNVEWDARAFPPYHPAVYFGTLASSIVLVGAALFCWRKRNDPAAVLLKFMGAALMLTMASPIAWEHHYGILIPIYAAMAALVADSGARERAAGVAASYVLCSNSLPFTNLTADTAWNVAQSYVFIGAIVLIGAIYVQRRRVAAAPTARDREPAEVA